MKAFGLSKGVQDRTFANIFSCRGRGLIWGCTSRNTIRHEKIVSYRGQQKLKPDPDWSPLGD